MDKFTNFCKSIVEGTGNVIVSVVDGTCDLARDAWNGIKSCFSTEDIITQSCEQHVDISIVATPPNPDNIWEKLDSSPANGRLDILELGYLKRLPDKRLKNIKNRLKVGTTRSEFIQLYSK